MTTETRQLRMHSRLLYDVIFRQAGTIAKAILEGVMNAVDAGATKCEITLTEKTLSISDDGKGFRSREEIENWFEEFGHPHEESEGKIYGQFRMGRGQIMAFGASVWETGQFVMRVDIKNNGFDYGLETRQKAAKGCSIAVQLYEPLSPTKLLQTQRELEQMVKYVSIPVIVNKRTLSKPPGEEKWDHDTPEAYVRLRASSQTLEIYNLGVHVQSMPAYKYGTGGIVVTKQQVKVNFARNQVLDTCPTWKAIEPFINKIVRAKRAGRKVLNDGERRKMIEDALVGIEPENLVNKPLFQLCTGKFVASWQLSHREVLTMAPHNSRLGDRIHRQGIAVVLSDNVLEHFGRDSLAEVMQACAEAVASSSGYAHLVDTFDALRESIVPFEQVTQSFSARYDIVDEKDYTPIEKMWMRLLRDHESHCRTDGQAARRIILGSSDAARGWTDGRTYIAIERRVCSQASPGILELTTAAHILTHEYCHENQTATDHDHDQAFYELYHDRSPNCIGGFVHGALRRLTSYAAEMKRGMNRAALRNADAVQAAELRREAASPS